MRSVRWRARHVSFRPALGVGIAVAGIITWTLATEHSVRADDEGPTGWELGLRASYGLPFGDVLDDSVVNASSMLISNPEPISQLVKGAVPIRLDAGYRWTPHLFVGGFFQYARRWCRVRVGHRRGHEHRGRALLDERLADRHRRGRGLRVAPALGVGPFVSLGLGEYLSAGETYWRNVDGYIAAGGAESVSNEALHGWVTLGLRGIFDFRTAGH